MMVGALFERLLLGQELTSTEANEFMSILFADEVGPASKGALLALLRRKGATGPELAAFAQFLRLQSPVPEGIPAGLIDTCGTGGGVPSFNLSTGAAIIAASAGALVAKHGNRAVTSKCGSADVLEALGVNISSSIEGSKRLLSTASIAFLFAQDHHPVMRKVGPVRKELGFKTVFNQLGPLANPFGAKIQLIGVYQADLVLPMSQALRLLGAERALVVHGRDGLDEISPVVATDAALLEGGKVTEVVLSPSDFGATPLDPSAIAPGETISEGAALLQSALRSPDSPRCRACIPNAAAALVLAGKADSWKRGAEMALQAVADGSAIATLERLVDGAGVPC